jgi:two-component sensor histidine kinase
VIKNLPVKYIWFILGGLGLGLILGFKNYIPYAYWGDTEEFSWQRNALPSIINYTAWGLLVPWVYYLVRKYKVGINFTMKQNFIGLMVSAGMAFFHEFTTNLVYFVPLHVLDWYPFTSETMNFILGVFPVAFISRIVEYWILYGLFSAFFYYKQYKEKQIELAVVENKLTTAKLSALRFQLQPHFLFNTLNTISSLSEIDVKKTQTTVSKLGILLRKLLDYDKRNMISLSEELEFIESYLDIEQIRFQDRLKVIYDVDASLMDAKVPNLILQPLVENAIKHGLATKTENGEINISISSNGNGELKMIVEDNGIGADKEVGEILNSGIGLKNLKERLQQLYKENYEMNIHPQKGNGFKVALSIPLVK